MSRDFDSPGDRMLDVDPLRSRASAGTTTLIVAVTLICCAVVVRQAVQIREQERAALERDSEIALERILGRVESLIGLEIAAISRMARRVEQRGIERHDLWHADALQHVNDFAHIQAIEWVDSDFIVRRIVPLEGNEAALNLDLSFEPRRRAALELARDEARVIISRTISLVQGGTGFLMHAPVYGSGIFEGYVLYVHRTEPMFEAVIGKMESNYEVRLRDGGEIVYDSGREVEIGTTSSDFAKSGRLSFSGLKLDLTVTPTKTLTDSFLTRLPEAVGIVGNAFALAVGLLVYQQISARKRMHVLVENSRALEEQIAMRQRAEDSEQVSHEELSRILASVGECLWSIRMAPDGTLEREYLSGIMEEISGYPVEYFSVANLAQLADEPWTELIVPEDREWVRALYVEIPLGSHEHKQFEYRITRSDGEVIWIRENYVRTRDLSGASQYDVIITDISESKRVEKDQLRLQERVQQTQKLESIGVLAGGIAHDFNNLLVGVLGNADLAANSVDCPAHIRENLNDIETAAQRASELCRELLAYSGRAPYVIAPIDLSGLVREMEKLLRFSIAPGIEIEIDFPEEATLVEGDSAQLRQLVMNSITNAVDSMEGRSGKIQVSIAVRWCESADFARTFTHESLPAGQYVVFSVIDVGCGMTPETLSRIFDPFFTTKVTGRGLGLAAALGIIRGHHGSISVTSELGVGTRSVVYLPALVKEQCEPEPRTPEREWSASGVVLYVDDEEYVRRVGTRILEDLGMKVVPAASGEEALLIFDSGADEFCCVVLDLMMPGLSGTDTLRAIRSRAPNLPVLIVTGYGESDAGDLLGGLLATGLLAKPFTSKQLEGALGLVLG